MEPSYALSRRIFETIVGSRAYGIHGPDSDYDMAGVMIPGKEFFMGWSRFDQFQGFPDQDRVLYDIRKALNLIAGANPNMMDLLYMPDRCIQLMTPYWEVFVENREAFLSKKIRYTYSGYAIAQLHRIKTHRKFLLEPPTEKPTRENFGLTETPLFPTSQLKAVVNAAMQIIADEDKPNFLEELDSIYRDYVTPLLSRYIMDSERRTAMDWLQMGTKGQARSFMSLGTKYIKDEYIDMAEREVKFYNACQEWSQYTSWKKGRNPARADLEREYLFDTKHASHLVRLLRCGEEGLRTGVINVDRTNIDAEELKAIRNGAWSFDEVEAYAQAMDEKLDGLYESTPLSKSPDRGRIEQLCVETVDRFFREKGK